MRFFTLILLFSLNVIAQTPKAAMPALKIDKGTEVKVVEHDAKMKLFSIEIVKESAVGPNYVDEKDYIKGIGYKGDLHQFLSRKASTFDTHYFLKSDLPLLTAEEKDRRLELLKPKK